MTNNILQVPITEEQPWVVFAACRSADPGLFFEGEERNPAAAKAVCNSCPVQIECLEYALEARLGAGIWGGLTTKERRKLQRKIA